MSNLITVDHILGNINTDVQLRSTYDQLAASQKNESILVSRMESQRTRMRKISNKGTDIALTITPGGRLRQGDVVLLQNDRIIVVEMTPENVLQVDINKKYLDEDQDHLPEVLVKIGHTIGNLHRPIKMQGTRIYFPIQAESEVDMFTKLFHQFHHYIDVKSAKIIFEPDENMDVHEH
jgi:urease accessory protein